MVATESEDTREDIVAADCESGAASNTAFADADDMESCLAVEDSVSTRTEALCCSDPSPIIIKAADSQDSSGQDTAWMLGMGVRAPAAVLVLVVAAGLIWDAGGAADLEQGCAARPGAGKHREMGMKSEFEGQSQLIKLNTGKKVILDRQ